MTPLTHEIEVRLKWNKPGFFMACLLLLLTILPALGCGGSRDNNDNGNGNGTAERDNDDYIDIEKLYEGDFRDGQYLKLEWWQMVDGEEAAGWIALEVDENEDSSFNIEYTGVLGEDEFAGVEHIEPGARSVKAEFSELFNTSQSPGLSKIWEESWTGWLDEFFGELKKVGDKINLMQYEVEARGIDTYAGQEGLTFIAREDNEVVYQICVSPELPVNLYLFHLDPYDNQYGVELVEYRE